MIRPSRAAFLVVGALLLAGCTPTGPGPSTAAHPRPPVPSTGTATPSASPATPGASCENIVTPPALTELTSAPREFFPEFTERMRAPGSQLYRFIELGGIACEWGHPNSDVVFDLATSPISDAQAATEKATLIQLGWSSSRGTEGWEDFTKVENDLYMPVYSFSSGRWRYALLEADLKLFA
jgi:hypothetical protein